MTKIILINKLKVIKELNAKKLTEETIYKKCNFKNNDHFKKREDLTINHNGVMLHIELWAKDQGKKGMENTYTLPFSKKDIIYYVLSRRYLMIHMVII